jgi:hypothetical protein
VKEHARDVERGEMRKNEIVYLAIVTRIASPHNTMAVPVIGVGFHLCVHSIIVVRLLLWLHLHLLRMSVGIDSCIITIYDADLLICLF